MHQLVQWIELCPLQNAYVETLAPSVTVFGDKAYKEVIKDK